MAWLIFIILSGVHLFFTYHEMQLPIIVSKASLMPSLIWALWKTTKLKPAFLKLVAIALFFGWVGDMALTQNGLAYFLGGLVAFLIGHLFYIYAFVKENQYAQVVGHLRNNPFMALPYVALMIFVVIYMGPRLGEFKIPVFAYSAILILMSVMALNRFNAAARASAWLIWLGSVLFVFSDFMIAWNKFIEPVAGARMIIMSTYLLGQAGIAYGLAISYKEL